MKKLLIFLLTILVCVSTIGCTNNNIDYISAGYSEAELIPEDSTNPLYIAGYKQGVEITGVLDYQKIKALYLNYYGEEILMMSIDCIGLASDYVNKIRSGINSNININICSTHTHAGIDTLGLWGPVAIDGKNKDFMDNLVNLAIQTGKQAISNHKQGILTLGKIETKDMLEDSREPYVYDEYMYQLRFIPNDKSDATRMIFYGAHAESLRSENTLLSADFPGYMAEIIKEKTNDNTIYFNGAIGGLIMTKVFDNTDLVNNMKITGTKLAEYALAIKETKLEKGTLSQKTTKFDIELNNTLFTYYKFLGILGNNCYKNIFTNKYYLKTETSILKISNITIILVPGEIFPELVYGSSFCNIESNFINPITILELTNKYNLENVIILGLANDEIGYIVPPSDFLVDNEYPYIHDKEDLFGENHYEETNSVGPYVIYQLMDALEKCLK